MSKRYLETQVTGPLSKLKQLSNNWQAVQCHQPKAMQNVSSWNLMDKLAYLREQKLGRLSLIQTPDFWKGVSNKIQAPQVKTLVHLDYTASAQALEFMEKYLQDCMKTYANTHTETSATGRNSTQRFHQAIELIRKHVGAGPDSFVISCGYGATGAVERIQKILGLYMSPKGQKTIQDCLDIDIKSAMKKKFVVFVGPTEHHSNDVTWQDAALCDFVRIKAIASGPQQNQVDLEDLKTQLAKYPNHTKIGSFSAASNVTGMASNLKEIGQILKAAGAHFFVDYAASGPYAHIDMERDGIDGIYLSMHKNLGGANLGILVGKNKIYDPSVHPSFGGGGTVSAVTPWEYHFHEKIEDREYPGTPAIKQVWQAALSFQIKEWIGLANIETIDRDYTRRLLHFMGEHPKIQILGNPDPDQRYPIFSFLVQHGQKMLHHTFVAAIFNDIFGIQARSGCACAGPFGHELLNISKEVSDKYVYMIENVLNGFKPGWTRIGLHYTLSETELDYVFKAINAIAFFGPLFLDQYKFNPYTGEWVHENAPDSQVKLSLENALNGLYGEASLEDENGLHMAFTQQWRDFLLMASAKIAKSLIAEVDRLSEEDHFDRITAAVFPIMQAFLESFNMDHKVFSHELAQGLCPVLSPTGEYTSKCEKQVIDTLEKVIFNPESQLEKYEEFEKIDSDVSFFYAPKDSVCPQLDMSKVKIQENCREC